MLQTTDRRYVPDISIVGAGIAGLSFAIACQNLGLKYTVYESATAIQSHGSGILLAPNSILALQLIDERLPKELAKLDNPPVAGEKVAIEYRHGQDGESWSALDLVYRVEHPEDTITVLRADYIRILASFVPEENIKFNRRLVCLNDLPSEQVQLEFQDGSTSVHDLVVGCDGIRSGVRRYVLGTDGPDATPEFAGKVTYRAMVDMKDARKVFEPEFLDHQNIFLGQGAHLVIYPVDQGQKLTMICITGRESWVHDKWSIAASTNDLKADYAGWDNRLSKLLDLAEIKDLSALFHLPSAKTFINGPLILVGDAAHASTPFQASGSSMAVEDTYILANLIARAAHRIPPQPEVGSPADHQTRIKAVLQAYDQIRRPRSQKLVRTSYENGLILELESPKFGRDMNAIREDMKTRLDWIWNVDLKAELDDAHQIMDSLIDP